METNCVQQVKPLASRSTACFFTSAANSVRGKCWSTLIEQARDLYDGVALLWAAFGEFPARNCSPTSIIGGHSRCFRLQEPALDKGGVPNRQGETRGCLTITCYLIARCRWIEVERSVAARARAIARRFCFGAREDDALCCALHNAEDFKRGAQLGDSPVAEWSEDTRLEFCCAKPRGNAAGYGS